MELQQQKKGVIHLNEDNRSLRELYGVNDDETANRMEVMLCAWMDNPLLNFKECAEKAGIGTTTFWHYRKNEFFMAEYRRRCRQRFESMEAKALERLEEKIDDGDWNATKYVLDGLDYGGKNKVELDAKTTIVVNVE